MTVLVYDESRGCTDCYVADSETLESADNPKRSDGVAVDVELPDGFTEEKMEAERRCR